MAHAWGCFIISISGFDFTFPFNLLQLDNINPRYIRVFPFNFISFFNTQPIICLHIMHMLHACNRKTVKHFSLYNAIPVHLHKLLEKYVFFSALMLPSDVQMTFAKGTEPHTITQPGFWTSAWSSPSLVWNKQWPFFPKIWNDDSPGHIFPLYDG